MSREALTQIRRGAVKKGDPLQTARLAGIMAAKQTSSLIPLCHPLSLSGIDVDLIPTARGYDIEARVRTSGQTGVEMEALTAVAVAALTIYDMVKAVDKRMIIGNIRLMKKTGGKSGTFNAESVQSVIDRAQDLQRLTWTRRGTSNATERSAERRIDSATDACAPVRALPMPG